MTTYAHRGPVGMDDILKAILALGTGLGAIVFGYHKFSVDSSRKDTAVAQEAANTSQFKALQDAINAQREETIELRAQFYIMDRKVHVQQRTMTRMEMLLRQFSGLVQEHGIPVPDFMQRELTELIEADQDRTTP